MFVPLSIENSVFALKQGKIIAYPTEAVFGLGVDAKNEQALANLLELKQREAHKGLILIASEVDQILPFIDISSLSKERWKEIQKHWPGFYTFVFPATPLVHDFLRGQYDSVAVRVSKHPVAKALCEAFEGTIVSTSANLAGGEPLKKGEEVYRLFGDSIFGITQGEVGGELKPSTIQHAITGEIYR